VEATHIIHHRPAWDKRGYWARDDRGITESQMMERRAVDQLFKTSYMVDVKPHKIEVFESDTDPIKKWISLGCDVSDNYEYEDKSWQDGFFVDAGINVSLRHFMWMLRQVNVNHRHAIPWLRSGGWELPPDFHAWLHTIVFSNNMQVITASRHRFEEAWMPTIYRQRFIIMEGAVVNVDKVVNVTSVWSNIQAYAQLLEQHEETGGVR